MKSLNFDDALSCPAGKRPRVTHFGRANFGDDHSADCAVLEDGRRGYVMRSLRKAIGIKKNIPVPRFEAFLGKITSNQLVLMGKSGSPLDVEMPHGGTAIWVEEGILSEIASGVIDSALDGRLAKNQAHLIGPCRAILKALAKTGERALIDEATGYQYSRAPDALQDLFTRLIRESAADWERQFYPEYYMALCKLFGFKYEPDRHRPLPQIIGKITMDWVYSTVFPTEIIAEIKKRKKSEKLHQWLTQEGGLRLLTRQKDAVTTIASSSVDYRDFEARCSVAFYKPGRQVSMVYPNLEARA